MKQKKDNLCWCGSGERYKQCHALFDQRLEAYRREGYVVPKKKMIKNKEQIEGIKAAAVINNGMLDYIGSNIKAGITTDDIDQMCQKFLKEHDAHSADLGYQGYPKSICTAVNDVVCHGIPSKNVVLKDGDIINVDATTEYKGYYADASRMYMIGEVKDNARKLVEVTKECLEESIKAIVPWESRISDIGKIIEKIAHANGYSVVEEYCGHGVGLKMHEDPYVIHYDGHEDTELIVPGMVFTIEPMINEGKKGIRFKAGDTWSSYTVDGKLSAQWEHTIVINYDETVEVVSF